jgi:DNA-binding response OmpR family regulator
VRAGRRGRLRGHPARSPDTEHGGFAIAARIRATPRSKTTPIVFLAAQGGGERVLDQVYALQAVDFLDRPLNPKVLLSKLSFFVELHRSKEQLRTERAFLAARARSRRGRHRGLWA